jgi:hypothetical protein
METIKVYHSKELWIWVMDPPPTFPEDYELVAIVPTSDLEIAYRDTNHIDRVWWENPNVQLVKESRSSSIGDVLVRGDEQYRCEALGWKRIN